jgi:cob(I)alamin adenosyltransferase
MAREGLIMVYTGNGKGKTTAALGVAYRALGHNLPVCVIQLMNRRSRRLGIASNRRQRKRAERIG